MKDEQESKFVLAFNRMPDFDHHVVNNFAKTSDWSKNTPASRINAYRLLLGAIDRRDPSLLVRSAPRITPQTVGWLIAEHEHRIGSQSVATMLRDLVGFCGASDNRHELQFIRDLARSFEQRAARDGPAARRRFALSPLAIPPQLEPAYRCFAPGSWYAKEFLRYLGAQAACGVTLVNLELAALGSNACLANFEKMIGDAANESRINQVGCVLQNAGVDPGVVFDRARELRRMASANPEIYDRRSRAFAELPEEVRERFKHVTTYSGPTQFEFGGVKMSLPKARRLDGRDFSEAEIEKMEAALRMHFTILSAADKTLATCWTKWGTPRALNLYKWFYAGLSPITQAARLEDLMAALRGIWGDEKRKLFQTERRQIQLLNGIARKIAAPLIVPFLPTRKVRCRARAIARKALSRWRDLKGQKKPYRDLKSLAGLFRNALIVAILAETPLRLRTMTLLTSSIIQKEGAVYVADIPPDLMKRRKAYFCTFSQSLSRLIDIWLDEVRPFFLGDREDVDALFLSDEGLPLSRSIFQTAIPSFMDAFFNERINMHLFRALHATELVDDQEAAAFVNQQDDFESQIEYQGAAARRDRNKTSSLFEQSGGFFAR